MVNGCCCPGDPQQQQQQETLLHRIMNSLPNSIPQEQRQQCPSKPPQTDRQTATLSLDGGFWQKGQVSSQSGRRPYGAMDGVAGWLAVWRQSKRIDITVSTPSIHPHKPHLLLLLVAHHQHASSTTTVSHHPPESAGNPKQSTGQSCPVCESATTR